MKAISLKISSDTANYRLEATSDLSEIPVAHWDTMLGDEDLFLSTAYLTQVEESLKGQMQFYYVLFWKDEVPFGLAYYQRIPIKGTGTRIKTEHCSFTKEPLLFLAERFNNTLKRNINRLNIRLLVNGNSFISGQYGHRFDGDVSDAVKFELLDQAIKTIRKEDKANPVNMVVVKDFLAGSVPDGTGLFNSGYQEVVLQPNMVLELDPEWKSFEDYMGAMTSKYRVRARSAKKKGAGLVVEPLGINGAREYRQEMYDLYRNIAEEAEFNMAFLGVDYFQRMRENMPDNFFITAYFKEERLVGFISYFLFGKHMEAHFMGYDKSINREYKLYQNVLYNLVETGIEAGVERICMGRTALEIKTTVGAVAHPMNCLLKADSSFGNSILKRLFKQLNNEELIPRSPFKRKKPSLND